MMVIRKIQVKKTSMMVCIPPEMLKEIKAKGGDYIVLEYDEENDCIIFKKVKEA